MEPDGREELPAPTGVTVNLNPDRVIQSLQHRAAALVQSLQWDLATRDALVEVLEEKLNEEAQLREEAEGALQSEAQELRDAREQIARLVKGEGFLLGKIEELTTRSAMSPAQRDAFLGASETLTVQKEPAAAPAGDEQ